MLRKILIVLGCLFGLVLVVAGAGFAYLYLRKPAQAPPSSIRVVMTPERIARGKYIFESVADCGGCHSQRDFTRVGGPEVPAGRGRGVILSDLMKGLPGTVVASNITPNAETGIGAWTDGEKIRAIREGVSRDGRALFPMMPYQTFRQISDDDAQALVAFLNSLPPVRNPLPRTRLIFPVSLMIKGVPQPAGSVPSPNPTLRVKYGEYLAAVGGCVDCHTPAEKGQPVPGRFLAGGQRFETSFGTVVSPNITPDLDTGTGKWSEEFFLNKFYDYKGYAENGPPAAAGPQAFTLMPWLAFSRKTPDDLGAIFAYLRTVPPIRNLVETHPGFPTKSAAVR
jgi:mono/diheme cytochrome c family protein